MPISRIKSALLSSTFRDSGISIAGQVTAGILGAIFFALAARILGRSDFGIFSLAYAAAIVLKDLVDLAANAALLRFVPGAQTHDQAQAFIKHIAFIKLGYFLILAPLLLVFIRPASFLIFQASYKELIILILLTALSLSFATLVSGIFRARRQFVTDAFMTATQPALRLLFLGIIILTHTTSIQSFLVANFIAYLFVSAVAIYKVGLSFLRAVVDKSVTAKVRAFLPPMVLATATGTLTEQANLFIVNAALGPAQVGLLSAVGRLFVPTRQIGGIIDSVFGSRFAAFDSRPKINAYLKQTLTLSSLMALALLITSVLAGPIVNIIYGLEYAASIPLFRVYTLAYALFILHIPFSAKLLYAKGRSDLLAGIWLVQLIITIIANLLLVPSLGLIGAGLAFAAVMVINLVVIAAVSNFAAPKH